MPVAFWWIYGALAVIGVASLVRIHRLAEIHHLYIGAAVALLPWPVAQWTGLVLMADDAVQHAVQAIDALRGLPPRPDWSPVHRAYVWAYQHVASL